jgi:multiple sugar transport system ATP-binding protein
MSRIIVRDVSKRYVADKGHEVTAVEKVNLTVESGEFMVIVGPSGCGKSTLLRMIAGLEEISEGDICIDEKRINDVPPKDRDIAMVFQNYALYPHMTVYKNLAFGLQLRNYPKAEIDRRVREAAQILGLTNEMLERKPKALSGGQRQRVALGRAMVRKPKVFLFDEPLSNLDAKMRLQMRSEIIKLHKLLATTMVYVTHDQVEAMTMADRICMIKDGRIQQTDAPLALYNNPANMFVAAFIGSPQMNFFEGSIVRDKNRLFFQESGGKTEGSRMLLQVLPEHEKKLESWIDKKLYLGLRPEDISMVARKNDPHSEGLFTATLETATSLGAESHLSFNTGAHSFTVRSQEQVSGSWDQSPTLSAKMGKAHYFQASDQALYQKEAGGFDAEKWQTSCARIT